MKKILSLLIGGVLLLSLTPAYADLSFSDPHVGRSDNKILEIGASGTISVNYTNRTGDTVNIDTVKLYLDCENAAPQIIDSISISNQRPGNFSIVENSVSTPGKIFFQMQYDPTNPAMSKLNVPNGESRTLAIVSFHIKQDSANVGRATYFIRFTTTDTALNVYVRDNVRVGEETGTLTSPTGIQVEDTRLPTFAGLETATDTTRGNSVDLNWGGSETGASDTGRSGGRAETLYPLSLGVNKLRYRIFEATSDTIRPQILGPDEDRTTYTRTGLNDNTPYWYAVRGQDNCTTTHNVDPNTTTVRVVPHDYTAPDRPSHTLDRSTDQTIHFRVAIPGGDTAGIVVIRKAGTTAPNFTPAQAAGDNDGTDPPAVGTFSGDTDAAVVYSGGSPGSTITINDSPLTNGAPFTYMVRAYDPIDGTPHQQGHNWSNPDVFTAYPGEPPPGVANLVAGGSGSGRISVRWTNPAVDYYGGAKVLITSDVTKWGTAMTYDSDTADTTKDFVKLASNKTVADPKPETEEVIIDNLGGASLTDGTVYYVGVFAYNKTTDPAARNPSAGSYAGTWPGGGGGGAITYPFTKAASGLGLNSFAVLQDTPLSVTMALEGGPAGTPVEVNTIAAFVNALGGPANVATIGWLEGDRMVGYYVTDGGGGAAAFTATEGAAIGAADTENMTRGRAYQISVLKTMSVTITGR